MTEKEVTTVRFRVAVTAAVLNFLVWGLGYVYMRRRVPFGAMVIAAILVAFGGMQAFYTGDARMTLTLFVMAWLIMSTAFAIDAYRTRR